MPSTLELVHDGTIQIRIGGVEQITLTPVGQEDNDGDGEPYAVRTLTITTFDATYEIVLTATEQSPLQLMEGVAR